jgi:hypothetical protein
LHIAGNARESVQPARGCLLRLINGKLLIFIRKIVVLRVFMLKFATDIAATILKKIINQNLKQT